MNKQFKRELIRLFYFVPDSIYLRIIYLLKTKKVLHLNNPITYTEKLQWLKINNRNPEYTKMVDKYEAKFFIQEKIGKEHVIPTIGVWDRFEDIDFNTLPDKFVLKTTHDQGTVFVCNNKNKINYAALKKKFDAAMKLNFFWIGREWPYKNIKPRIIAEKHIECDNEEGLVDYKFFCFNGEPKIMYRSNDFAREPKTDFFDMNGNVIKMFMRDDNSDVPPQLPSTFEKMKSLAKELSVGLPHIRVDFYSTKDEVYVGELTFYHNSGFSCVHPDYWERKLGEWINIAAI